MLSIYCQSQISWTDLLLGMATRRGHTALEKAALTDRFVVTGLQAGLESQIREVCLRQIGNYGKIHYAVASVGATACEEEAG